MVDYQSLVVRLHYLLRRSDLTSGRVVLAGGSGALQDNSNLTFNGSQLGITGTVNASSTITGTEFHTGASGSAIRVTSNTISGPATFTLDPAGVGDNTGKVIIAGDLQVDGTTTTVNSTTVNIVDKNIQVATGSANDAAANGGGITIASGDGNKTFQFEATGDNLASSEHLNLASGKDYKINNTSVLNATTLGSGVVNSSLTNVGTLTSLDVSGQLLVLEVLTATWYQLDLLILIYLIANTFKFEELTMVEFVTLREIILRLLKLLII